MTLNASGPIWLGGSTAATSVDLELGNTATTAITLNDVNARKLNRTTAGSATSLSTYYGKTKLAITGQPSAVSYSGASGGGAATTGSTTCTVVGTSGFTYNWVIVNSVGTGTINGQGTATASVTSSPANGVTNSGTLQCQVIDATNGFGTLSSSVVAWSVQNTSSSRVAVNLTISANTTNYNIFSNKGGTYSAGHTDVTLTINSGIVVGSTSTATYALDTGTGWTAGDTVKIINNGYIAGRGGAGGGAPGTAGAAGGPGLRVQFATSITNAAGYIYSGGGGGGAGGAAPNGAHGAGGGGAGINLTAAKSHGQAGSGGAAGGALGVAGAAGTGIFSSPNSTAKPGGGGGGGGGGGASGGPGAAGWIGGSGAKGGHGVAIQGASLVTFVSGNTRVYGGTAG